MYETKRYRYEETEDGATFSPFLHACVVGVVGVLYVVVYAVWVYVMWKVAYFIP